MAWYFFSLFFVTVKVALIVGCSFDHSWWMFAGEPLERTWQYRLDVHSSKLHTSPLFATIDYNAHTK